MPQLQLDLQQLQLLLLLLAYRLHVLTTLGVAAERSLRVRVVQLRPLLVILVTLRLQRLTPPVQQVHLEVRLGQDRWNR